MKKVLKIALYVLAGAFVVIQVIPDGLPRENPPVETSVQWPSDEAKTLFYNACADCHSHETKWPWYSYVAPIKWGVKEHVVDGRKHFNISVKGFGKDANEAGEVIREDYMPLEQYLIMHSEAKLTAAQKETLANALDIMFAGGGEEKSGGAASDSSSGSESHEEEH